MKIGIMLRHIEQQEGGVKVYTQSVLPRLFALGGEHEYLLIYQSRKALGRYASFPNVTEVAATLPGTVTWDQIAVPWIARKFGLELIFNPKITIPLLTRARTVYVVHGAEKFAIPEHFRKFDRWYFQRMMPLYARHADGIVAVAEGVRQAVVDHLGVEPTKVRAIHNGFDAATFAPVRDEERLAQVRHRYRLPERFILWAGQIESRKNVGRLLKAFALLRHDLPHTLVLAGEARWNSATELQFIDQLGLTDRVLLTGWIPHADLAAVYSLADLFIFPSLFEGFGIPLVEAMACGCPVVTAKTGSPPEIVSGAAQLVDPLDVRSIADGIAKVLGGRDRQAELRARGIARAKAFSWDKCARELLEVFDNVGRSAAVERLHSDS